MNTNTIQQQLPVNAILHGDCTILPALLVTLFVCIYGLVKIPELTGAILSGRSGTWVNPTGK